MGLATIVLDNLPLLSLDLETTGLRPKTDRIVQIGAVDPFDSAVQFDQLVNPGIPIPASTTAIHHIDDAMVAQAPNLAAVFSSLRGLAANRVLIGYNIGFDLAVLQAEANRHGLEWEWTGALCIRQLATIALGSQAMLMISDLEALAQHYNISQANRHTALGDAVMSAGIFQAMLPDLKEKSVTTLGDAWRAVGELDQTRLLQANAGWVDVAALNQQAEPLRSLARIDPFPYQHRIHEIMLHNPVILPAETTVLQAAERMKSAKLDCVFVGNSADKIEGIVSERDVVHAVALPLSEVATARNIQLGAMMSAPVITVREQDFMHVGLGRIGHHDIRHLGVVDENGALTGWLSLRELTRQRLTEAVVIGDKLSTAISAEDMRSALQELPLLASSLLADGVRGDEIASVISGEYRSSLRRAAILAEQMLTDQGRPPPCDYAVLVLGSAGRGESLLAADQDHAIIYADTANSPQQAALYQSWFEECGQLIADMLDSAGIPYCPGKVMSSQPEWCRSLKGWQEAIKSWIGKSRPQDLLNVDIFFDFALVHGDVQLVGRLRRMMTERAAANRGFLKLLARNTGGAQAGMTLFGGLKTDNGRFHIKLHILLPLIETLRVLAISRGIEAQNSAARAEALLKTGTLPAEIGQFSEDIKFSLKLLLRQQIEDISAGLAPSSKIAVEGLSPSERHLLKAIQGRIKNLEPLIQACLFDR